MSRPSEKTPLVTTAHSNYDVPSEYKFEGDEAIGTSYHTDISSLSDDDEASQLEEGNLGSEISTSSQVINIGIANSPFLVATKNQTIRSPHKSFDGGKYEVKYGFSKLKGLRCYGDFEPTDRTETIYVANPAREKNPYAPAIIPETAAGYIKIYPWWDRGFERYDSFMKVETDPSWGSAATRFKRKLQRFTAEYNKLLSGIGGGSGLAGMIVFLGVNIGLSILTTQAKNVATTDDLLDIIGAGNKTREAGREVITKLKNILHVSAILIPTGGFALFLVMSVTFGVLIWGIGMLLNLMSRAPFAGPVTNINFGPTDLIALPQGVNGNEAPNYVEYQGKYYILKDEPVGIIKTVKQIAEKGQKAPEVNIPKPEFAPPAFTGSKLKNMQGVSHIATSDAKNVYQVNLTHQAQQRELQGKLQSRRDSIEQSKTFKAIYNHKTVYLQQENNIYDDNNSGMAILQVSDKNNFVQPLAQKENDPAIRRIIALAVKNVVGSKKIYHDSLDKLPENMNKLYTLIGEHTHYEKLMNDYVEIFKKFYSEVYRDRPLSFKEMLASIEQNPANIDDLPHFGQLSELQRKQQDTAARIETLANSQEVYNEFMEFLSTGGQITPTLIKAYCMATDQYCRIWTVDAKNANQLQYDQKNTHLPSGEGEIIDIIYDPNNSNLGHFYKADFMSAKKFEKLSTSANLNSEPEAENQQLIPSVSSNVSSLFGKKGNKNQSSSTMPISNLAKIGLVHIPMRKNGDCLYDAVSCYLEDQDAASLRRIVAANLRHNLQDFRDHITLPKDKTMDDYLNNIGQGKEWASHIEIEVLMRVLDRPIVVIESNNQLVNPSAVDSGRFTGEPIFVYYNPRNNHYDGLILNGKSDAQAVLDQLLQQQQTSSLQLTS